MASEITWPKDSNVSRLIFTHKYVETLTDFIFLCCQTSVDGDCSREIKRRSLLASKAVVYLGKIVKSRDTV